MTWSSIAPALTLLMRLDVLAAVGGFPVASKLGGEDLGLGFMVRAFGYDIEPVPYLENSDTPPRLRIMITQLAGWFLGSLGYLLFWVRARHSVRSRNPWRLYGATALGIWTALKWLCLIPVLSLHIWLAVRLHMTIWTIAFYLTYYYFGFLVVTLLVRRLPIHLFDRPSRVDILRIAAVYWLVPLIRNLAAVKGLYWGLCILSGANFLKPKTERA